jgi:hypothetical protein
MWSPENLTVVQLIKNVPTFYRTQRFTAVFKTVWHCDPSRIMWIHLHILMFRKINFNIIFPSTASLPSGLPPSLACIHERLTVANRTHVWRRRPSAARAWGTDMKSPGICIIHNTHLATFPNNSGALVRQRTIPTERPPLVGEVSANFSG